MSNFARQLEKELNEAKVVIQLMEHGKYGRVDLSEQIRELTSRLKASERANSVMREALNNIPKCHIPKAPSDVRIDSAAWFNWMEQRNKALSSTSCQSYIPREVAERMFYTLENDLAVLRQLVSFAHSKGAISPDGRISINDTKEVLVLAQTYGLGKEKE